MHVTAVATIDGTVTTAVRVDPHRHVSFCRSQVSPTSPCGLFLTTSIAPSLACTRLLGDRLQFLPARLLPTGKRGEGARNRHGFNEAVVEIPVKLFVLVRSPVVMTLVFVVLADVVLLVTVIQCKLCPTAAYMVMVGYGIAIGELHVLPVHLAPLWFVIEPVGWGLQCNARCVCHTVAHVSPVRAVAAIGIMFVLAARKVGLSLSVVGVAVDFLQVVSLFSSFGFAWPVQLTAVFKAASASTINEQLVRHRACVVSLVCYH